MCYEDDAPAAGARQRPGILVVDDAAPICCVVQSALERHGFRVWTAHCADEALELYLRERLHIDMVLLDVCMPDLDGVETLTALRVLEPTIQACFMSGALAQYSMAELLHHGVRRVFVKPLDLIEMAQTLHALTATNHIQNRVAANNATAEMQP